MIQIELVQTTLNGQTFYTARVRQSGVTTTDMIADMISARNIASPEVVRAVLDALDDVIIECLLRGDRVMFAGLMQISLSIAGKFAAPDSPFDAAHTLNIDMHADRSLERRLREQVEIHRANPTNLSPMPQTVTGLHCNLAALDPKDVVQINGTRLYFDPTRPDEGVFLVPTGPAPTAERVTNYLDHGDKVITFQVPNGLTPGPYYVEVRGRARNSKPESELRIGRAPQTITPA